MILNTLGRWVRYETNRDLAACVAPPSQKWSGLSLARIALFIGEPRGKSLQKTDLSGRIAIWGTGMESADGNKKVSENPDVALG